jgi:phage gpG-like protein
MIPRLAAIPARPFLGLSTDDEKEVIEIMSAFVL